MKNFGEEMPIDGIHEEELSSKIGLYNFVARVFTVRLRYRTVICMQPLDMKWIKRARKHVHAVCRNHFGNNRHVKCKGIRLHNAKFFSVFLEKKYRYMYMRSFQCVVWLFGIHSLYAVPVHYTVSIGSHLKQKQYTRGKFFVEIISWID